MAAEVSAYPLQMPHWIAACSIWWQFIPYFLVGAAETFTNVGEHLRRA
jgi:hypothetical protein